MAKVYLILAIAKKHLFSLICFLVAVAAAGSTMYFSGWYADLHDRVAARQSVDQKLTTLAKKPRTMPIVNPDSNDAEPLKHFPTRDIIKQGEDVTKEVALDSGTMLKEAVDRDRHDPLLPGILPNNPSQSMGVKFQQAYATAIDYMSPDHRDASMPDRVLKGGTPPTPAEIATRKQDIQNDLTAKMQYVNGQPINQTQIQQQITDEQAKVDDEMRADAARKFKIYVDDGSIKFATNIAGATTPEATAIFNAQVGLWLVQDVLGAIADANSKSDSVINSPVKRLIRLSYPDEPIVRTYGMTVGGPGGPQGAPPPPSMDGGDDPGRGPPPPANQPAVVVPQAAPGTLLVKAPTRSPTGRFSNFMYDVVPFILRMDVSEKDLPMVLATLAKGRFIDVANVNITALDSAPLAATGYIYGKNPVVRVEVQGEEYFMRDWMISFMPDRILAALGVQRPAPPAPGGAAPPPPPNGG
jgi:hypothetical protein